MPEDMHSAPAQVDTNAFKIMLLENNVVINKAIEASGDKITKAVNDRTDTYIGQITTLATQQGTQQAAIDALTLKISNLWSKVAGLVALASTVAGGIAYLISKVTP